VFEPFAQLAVDRQVNEGTGLGLTISKRLAALMQGSLAVESQAGRGSVFTLAVPLTPVEDAGVALELTEYAVTGYPGPRRHVLVVDDNPHNASLLVSLLTPLGFEVSTAQDGAQALFLAGSRRMDLAVLDLVMPELDGVEVAGRLRLVSNNPGIRIIGASAAVSGSSRKEEFCAVCDDFVTKPIGIDRLLEKIGQQLGLAWETVPGEREASSGRVREPEDALAAPVGAELEELYRYALLGDMRQVAAFAARLERQEPYRPFAVRLKGLAEGFRTKAVLALVERRLEAARE